MSFEIRDLPEEDRYEAYEGQEELGLLTYRRARGRMELIHTVTDPDQRERGVASALVSRAFADARARGERILIICPFVESWLERHPEQGDIVIGD